MTPRTPQDQLWSNAFSACITTEVQFVRAQNGQCYFEDSIYGKGTVSAEGTVEQICERICDWLTANGA